MRFGLAIIALATAAGPIAAQCSDTVARPRAGQLRMLGDDADDRRRILQDLGRCPDGGLLIRSTSTLNPQGPGWRALLPTLQGTWNSRIPLSANDGALAAGRGMNVALTGGLRGDFGNVSFVAAPTLVTEANATFPILPSGNPSRSDYASPWHSGVESADLPLRFGNRPNRRVTPGESNVQVRAGTLAFGASSESQWWGPGVRNALVLSNNAAGIPHLFLRTLAPIETRLGRIEGRWMLGGLTQSLYFDRVDTNDLRSFSALVATLRLAVDTGLTLGVARAVYAPLSSRSGLLGHAVDVLARWDQSADSASPAPAHPSDQLVSVFGRWVFPDAGVEFYGEWATLLPPSARELLVAPEKHQGFTVGLQWAEPIRTTAIFRLQGEVTTLEQTPPTNGATIPSFYVSRFVPQGYTQQGQVIGAAIGPGSSSQWLAGDYLTPSWRVGLEVGRIRWEDEAYYRQTSGISRFAHDVSLFVGIRGGLRIAGNDLMAELLDTHRMNYLFQNSKGGFDWDTTFDVHNLTLRLSITPRGL